MKYLLTLIIAAVVITGVWYGVGTYRRKQILASGRPVLLVNSKAGVYTYSDLMEADDITSSYKIIGYTDELSANQITEATVGMHLLVGVQAQPGDPRVIQTAGGQPIIPTDAEQKLWATALATLPKPQQDLCARLNEPTLTQACLSEHLVWGLVKAGEGVKACDVLYIPAQKELCTSSVSTKNIARFSDANNNQLIDGFEQLAIPYEQRENTYNLPVINPSE